MKVIRFLISLVVGLVGFLLLSPFQLDIMVYDTYYVVGYAVLWVLLWTIFGIWWLVKKQNRAN